MAAGAECPFASAQTHGVDQDAAEDIRKAAAEEDRELELADNDEVTVA